MLWQEMPWTELQFREKGSGNMRQCQHHRDIAYDMEVKVRGKVVWQAVPTLFVRSHFSDKQFSRHAQSETLGYFKKG